MIVYATSGKVPVGITPRLLKRLGGALHGVRGLPRAGVAGLRFVPSKEIHRLNRTFRHKDRPTDVLSFSVREGAAFPVARSRGAQNIPEEMGDIVVCPAVARAEARRRSMDTTEELIRLIAHGTLHLAGMDHGTVQEEERMFRIQEQAVEQTIG